MSEAPKNVALFSRASLLLLLLFFKSLEKFWKLAETKQEETNRQGLIPPQGSISVVNLNFFKDSAFLPPECQFSYFCLFSKEEKPYPKNYRGKMISIYLLPFSLYKGACNSYIIIILA